MKIKVGSKVKFLDRDGCERIGTVTEVCRRSQYPYKVEHVTQVNLARFEIKPVKE